MLAGEFKEAVHGALREAGISMLADYIERVQTDGDIDDRRKAVQLMLTTLGVEEDKKKGASDGLPTFIFNIGRGGISAEQVVTVEALPPEAPELSWNPSPAMQAHATINQDVSQDESC